MQEAVCAAGPGGCPTDTPGLRELDCRVNASIFTEQGSCYLDPVKGARMLGSLKGANEGSLACLSFFLSPLQLL